VDRQAVNGVHVIAADGGVASKRNRQHRHQRQRRTPRGRRHLSRRNGKGEHHQDQQRADTERPAQIDLPDKRHEQPAEARIGDPDT
jgi:hypothetical protein